MNEVRASIGRVKEDATAARAYFHTWWGLVNLALPKYRSTMRNFAYVDFFHVANAGFLKLTFVSLAKIVDRDDRALGLRKLRKVLADAGFQSESELIEARIEPHSEVITRVLGVRNRSVGHSEAAMTRDEVFDHYGITPDEIRDLVAVVCDVLNIVDDRLGSPTRISDGSRFEQAVLALLEQLRLSGRGT